MHAYMHAYTITLLIDIYRRRN